MPAADAAKLSGVDAAWAWARYEPTAEAPWDIPRAAHLLRRAGFAPTLPELQAALAAGPAETLRRLIAGGPESESFYQQNDRVAESLVSTGSMEHMPAWWLFTMLRTPHGLREKMTLFWHSHFATSADKVTDVRMMYRQNAILRRHALGKFGPLLVEASKDPAMLLWLDSATNHKAHPNENFAREVMELFTLGLGNYSEKDIQEAARALTGWEVRGDRFWNNEREHDVGAKTVLGQSGPWTGDDVLRMLLVQPAAARFLVRKLLRFFVSDEGDFDDALTEPLAADFRQHDYDQARLLEKILGSNLFFSQHAMGMKIKSPVEFGVGLARALEGTTDAYALASDLRKLGQGVFYPPNVKGWDGGRQWINSATLLGRANLAWAMVSGVDGRYKRKIPLARLAAQYARGTPAESARLLADLLISRPLPEAVYVQLATLAADNSDGDVHRRWARVVQAITALPEYQIT